MYVEKNIVLINLSLILFMLFINRGWLVILTGIKQMWFKEKKYAS